jgi:hypothetical protein
MAEIKTKQTDADVHEFINSFADTDQKRKDSFELLKLMQDFTGYEPKMWGPSIIGFGSYHYKSDEAGRKVIGPLLAFRHEKRPFHYTFILEVPEHEHLLKNLGKFKMGKACIYIKKLSDIDQNALKNLMKETISFLKSKYGEH